MVDFDKDLYETGDVELKKSNWLSTCRDHRNSRSLHTVPLLTLLKYYHLCGIFLIALLVILFRIGVWEPQRCVFGLQGVLTTSNHHLARDLLSLWATWPLCFASPVMSDG